MAAPRRVPARASPGRALQPVGCRQTAREQVHDRRVDVCPRTGGRMPADRLRQPEHAAGGASSPDAPPGGRRAGTRCTRTLFHGAAMAPGSLRRQVPEAALKGPWHSRTWLSNGTWTKTHKKSSFHLPTCSFRKFGIVLGHPFAISWGLGPGRSCIKDLTREATHCDCPDAGERISPADGPTWKSPPAFTVQPTPHAYTGRDTKTGR